MLYLKRNVFFFNSFSTIKHRCLLLLSLLFRFHIRFLIWVVTCLSSKISLLDFFNRFHFFSEHFHFLICLPLYLCIKSFSDNAKTKIFLLSPFFFLPCFWLLGSLSCYAWLFLTGCWTSWEIVEALDVFFLQEGSIFPVVGKLKKQLESVEGLCWWEAGLLLRIASSISGCPQL